MNRIKTYTETNNFWCFSSARVAVAQSSSLSLFTNRDAELEQRAMLLKRLAFTIYSSEVDQYQKYLPDIQGKQEIHVLLYTTTVCRHCMLQQLQLLHSDLHLGQLGGLPGVLTSILYYMSTEQAVKTLSVCSERLVESLRLPQVPILHAQVFLFFRVLLLRMSPQHLTSLWPTMITELVRNRQ